MRRQNCPPTPREGLRMDALLREEPAARPAPGEARTRSALEFVHGLLRAAPGDRPWVPGLLGDLARAFGATGAGLQAPLDGTPAVRQRVRADGSIPAP